MFIQLTRITALLGIAAACLLGSSPRGFAHGELPELIEKATAEIQRSPKNPELYLHRAELNRLYHAFDAAMADLDRADALSNQWRIVHFVRARVMLDAQWFQSAKVAADRFLAFEPNHVEALLTRARARVKLGERVAAADDFTRALQHTADPVPEVYLERSQALVEEGGTYLGKALEGLEQAIAKLGPVTTLQMAAIQIELKQNRVDAALARLDAAMAQATNKETWLVRRGEILRQVGRNQEAMEAYKAALKSFEKLPPARRSVPALIESEKRIRMALSELGVTEP